MKTKSILLVAVCMSLTACIPEVETANTASGRVYHPFSYMQMLEEVKATFVL